MEFVHVKPEHIAFAWERAKLLLKHATEPDTIEAALHDHTMQLWLGLDHATIRLAGVTQLLEHPTKKVRICRLMMVGGSHLFAIIKKFDLIEAFARKHRCQAMIGYFTPKIAKIMRRVGFVRVGATEIGDYHLKELT